MSYACILQERSYNSSRLINAEQSHRFRLFVLVMRGKHWVFIATIGEVTKAGSPGLLPRQFRQNWLVVGVDEVFSATCLPGHHAGLQWVWVALMQGLPFLFNFISICSSSPWSLTGKSRRMQAILLELCLCFLYFCFFK